MEEKEEGDTWEVVDEVERAEYFADKEKEGGV
jgi:hypothetical protein